MSNEELTRRVNKLRESEGYILDALEDIATVQRQHTRRLKAHDARFDGIDSALQEVLRRLPEPPQD